MADAANLEVGILIDSKFEEGFDGVDTSVVVRGKIVTIGKMERVDIVLGDREALIDNFEGEFVGGGTDGAPGGVLAKEGFFVDLAGIRGVVDEKDLDLLITTAKQAEDPTAGDADDILFIFAD